MERDAVKTHIGSFWGKFRNLGRRKEGGRDRMWKLTEDGLWEELSGLDLECPAKVGK
ncbi:hypothetical protein STEG23_030198, partial [Scotinomys teguina]